MQKIHQLIAYNIKGPEGWKNEKGRALNFSLLSILSFLKKNLLCVKHVNLYIDRADILDSYIPNQNS